MTFLFTSVTDCRARARRKMPRMVFDALDGATGNEIASRRNTTAFEDVCLQGRVLVNVEDRSLKTQFLDREWQMPFGVAPMGMGNLFWPGADQALARAARDHGFPLGVSTMSSTPLEQMLEQSGGNAWFQLYAGESDALTKGLLAQAAQAGYHTLILTADVPALAPRPRDQRNGFTVPFRLRPRQFIDLCLHPRWSLTTLMRGIPKPRNISIQDGASGSNSREAEFRREAGRGRFDWRFLSELRSQWPQQLVLKGVMSAEDAKMAVSAGVDAVYVSNHGGRQLDSAPAAISVLPKVREAVGPDFPLIFDSGVRSGEDVARALASGADFVMVGRPALYALGAGGPSGFEDLLHLLMSELSTVMAQLGCRYTHELNETVRVS
ncbi:MAG: alpha-hydroxy acid oxidase [Arenicellales bacterium]|jgi:L-lactate dehydrogenase (cytochrome)|nr:alpha-hydroxy acid oxidase [Arenicellales bacterium]MDP6919379.1 alpha-hydroxy acid oxidase [Arenicellales bacterium]|tara:strand:- start:16871 stop:18010 length:1140 start_codon:yes stop_codon:yes gene_type:complete